MRNLKIKNFVYLLVGLSAGVWLGLSAVTGLHLSNLEEFLKLIPMVVTVDTIVILIFTKWLWAIPLFRGWLVPFPNLNGTWLGKIYSDWIDPKTGVKVPEIPVMLTIKQSFFGVNCVMRTGEMTSYSQVEGFSIDADRQLKHLSYVYTSYPRIALRERSTVNEGAAVFELVERPNRKLKGRYWTDRKTTGEIAVEFSDRRLLEDIPDNQFNHPVTELENRH